ncbi:hypothetical protein [Sphingomonas solaris]|uniref:Uncharacterized protein n=1 Tax=Alterirhizorhabdus solaris TaxID=2529389 RepID=A0A558QY44_9SPHN|nr:hypothetical protein [Sphingomonas solaris]TVV72018.1 hypothetical protein FOY91_15575 [Sphingomonas solaris]
MEEKRPGQQPEADRTESGELQNRAARPGGRAKGGLAPTEQDRALVNEADRASETAAEELKEGGFGDNGGGDENRPILRSE